MKFKVIELLTQLKIVFNRVLKINYTWSLNRALLIYAKLQLRNKLSWVGKRQALPRPANGTERGQTGPNRVLLNSQCFIFFTKWSISFKFWLVWFTPIFGVVGGGKSDKCVVNSTQHFSQWPILQMHNSHYQICRQYLLII